MLPSHPIKSLGNLLILASLVGFTTLAFPFIRAEISYRFTPSPAPNQTSDFTLTIPDLKITSPVIAHVDPWNKSLYASALKKGVAHASGSALPGQSGTVYLFAHSSGNPWEQAYTNTIFYRLKNINENNILTLNYQGQIYRYQVTGQQIVSPHQIEALTQNQENQLILQTCWPIGTDWQRLLVFARPL